MRSTVSTTAKTIDATNAPTHIANVIRRLEVVGPDASGDTFLATSYVAEAFVKTIAIAFIAAVRQSSPEIAHRFEYEVVRADGLGTWEKVISDFCGQSNTGYLSNDLKGMVAWLTKKRNQNDDKWAHVVLTNCNSILEELGAPDHDAPAKPSVRSIITKLVRIRNKTKGHGAVGPDFFEKVNSIFIESVGLLVLNSPLVEWEWYHLTIRKAKDTVRALLLRDSKPVHVSGRLLESVT